MGDLNSRTWSTSIVRSESSNILDRTHNSNLPGASSFKYCFLRKTWRKAQTRFATSKLTILEGQSTRRQSATLTACSNYFLYQPNQKRTRTGHMVVLT